MFVTVSEDMQLCVKRGAAWMDEHYPGWIERINLSELDMNNCHRCIIGQTIGDYFQAKFDDDYREEWANEHGFETKKYGDYSKLETAWTEYIRDHR